MESSVWTVEGCASKRLVSASSRNAFTRCERHWELSSLRGLRPKVEAIPLGIGKLAHKCREMWYRAIKAEGSAAASPLVSWDVMLAEAAREMRAKVTAAGLSPEEADKREQRIFALQAALHHWFEVFGERDAYEVEVIAIEQPYIVPMLQRVGKRWRVNPLYANTGKVDLALKVRATGQVLVDDFKTTSDASARDWQDKVRTYGNGARVGYVYALGDWFVKGVAGIRYDVLRLKAPATPATTQCRSCKGTGVRVVSEFVKDANGKRVKLDDGTFDKTFHDEPCEACNRTGIGGVSKVACDTTAAVFRAEVERVAAANPNADLTEAQEQLRRLEREGDRFVHRFTSAVTRTEILRWADDQNEMVARMTDAYNRYNRGRRLVRNLMACSMGGMTCPFAGVCEHDAWEGNPSYEQHPSDPFNPHEARGDNEPDHLEG